MVARHKKMCIRDRIRIPEEILNKPGRLTVEEFKIMKTHSELGADIIKDMDFPQDHPLVHTAWEICRWHHERWNGCLLYTSRCV